MSISTADAEQMVADKMARESTEPAQPEENVEPKVEEQPTPDPKPEEPKEPEPEPEKKQEEVPQQTEPEKEAPKETPKDNPEDTDKSDKKPPKKKYTAEERTAHKFAQLKQKHKEQREKDQARIKELEDKLKKYEGLKLEDFGEQGTQSYVDWKLEERDMQNEVKAAKERIERMEAEDLERETERRINLSFDTEEEKAEYEDLVRDHGKDFIEALKKHDPENVVLNYLNNVEQYPKVLKVLMEDMDALRHVFRDKDPYELRHNLHEFTKELLSGNYHKEAPVVEKQIETKPVMPVIGKQVTTPSAPTEPVHDRAYWNNYLKTHPRG